jgi:hypothetical protein
MSIFACMLWSLWKQRNDVVWINKRITKVVVCDRRTALLTKTKERPVNPTGAPQAHAQSTVWQSGHKIVYSR